MTTEPERVPATMPTPTDLADYAAVLPGLPQLMWDEVQLTLAHARDLEQRDARSRTRGQWMGFLIALAFLAVSGWLIHEGKEAAGVILGSVDLVALVTVFVVGRLRR